MTDFDLVVEYECQCYMLYNEYSKTGLDLSVLEQA